MSEPGFSSTRIFLHNDRIYDSAIIRENTGLRKLVSWHIPHSHNLFNCLSRTSARTKSDTSQAVSTHAETSQLNSNETQLTDFCTSDQNIGSMRIIRRH